MMGYETLWMPGTDHAGIATQAVVEKRLRARSGEAQGPSQSLTRDAFVAKIQAFKDEYEAVITGQLKAHGLLLRLGPPALHDGRSAPAPCARPSSGSSRTASSTAASAS
jgi:hypothetical protein